MVHPQTRPRFVFLGALLALCLAAAPATFAGSTTAADHSAVKAWAKAWSTGSDDLESFLSQDVSFSDPFFSFNGLHHYRDLVDFAHRSWTDLELEVDDLIVDGDRGAFSWTISGTHNLTGKSVEVKGVSILRFDGDKISSEWRVYDAADLAKQIGGSVTYPGDGGRDGSGGGDGGSASSE